MNIVQYDGNVSCSENTVSEISSEHWSDYLDLENSDSHSFCSNHPSGRSHHPSGTTVSNEFQSGSESDHNAMPSWYDEFCPQFERLPPVRIHIRRNNNAIIAAQLPVISVCNMRSFIPKIQNFAFDMLEREIDLSFLSEVWEKVDVDYHR